MIRNKFIGWIFDLPFFSDYIYRIRDGAFRDAHKDIMQTMRDDLDKKAEELAKEKLATLLSPVDPRMIISMNEREKAIYIGGKRAEPSGLKNLKNEVDFLEQSDLWKILYNSPKALAEKAMFKDDGILENQLLKGRAVLFTLDTQKTILDTLKRVI